MRPQLVTPLEVDDVAILIFQALDAARGIRWLCRGFLSKWKSQNLDLARLQIRIHAYGSSLDSSPDGTGADKVDAVEVWEHSGQVLALLATIWSQIRIRNGLIVIDVVVALGMADEVDCPWSHDSAQ